MSDKNAFSFVLHTFLNNQKLKNSHDMEFQNIEHTFCILNTVMFSGGHVG